MPTRREHAERANSEARSREHSYDQLKKKTSRETQQLDFDLETPHIPSRDDAQRIVEQRRKARQSAAKAAPRVVRQPAEREPGSKPHRPATKTKNPKTSSSGKKGKGAVAKQARGTTKAKKRQTVQVQISLPVFIVAVVVFALLAGSLIAWQIVGFGGQADRILGRAEPEMRSVTITPGMSARQIAQLLSDEGVLEESRAFERYLELSGDATRLQAGSYLLGTHMSHAELAEHLVVSPRTNPERSVVVYAGYTLQDIDSLLNAQGLARNGEFLQAAETIARKRGLPFVEGWFLSGTHTLPPQGEAAITLAMIMQDALNDAVRPYLAILEEKEMSLSDTLVIASMIQRETNKVAQMPIISGVIHNRLRAGMPLGIDATLRYGLDAWNRELSSAEIRSEHPFNTRHTVGLPPSGIGSPSLAALDAAFKPAVHSWYFYIHDKGGELHPAVTYDEHKANIERYLR